MKPRVIRRIIRRNYIVVNDKNINVKNTFEPIVCVEFLAYYSVWTSTT